MSKVGIVTDSTSCLPEGLIEEFDIKVVPVGVTLDDRTFMDTDITAEEFWRLFKAAKNLPTTHAANPASFASAFKEHAKTKESVLCILVSHKLSATHEAAIQAKEMVREDYPNLQVEIMDSKTSTGALGFIVLEAARAAKENKSLSEVMKVVEDMIPRVKFVVGMNTMKYLIKTGRAPKSALIGEFLKIKPLIGMVSGTGLVESMGRVNGWSKTMLKLAEMVQEHTDTSKPLHVMVHYTDSIENGEELKSYINSKYNCAEVHLTPYSPVMAAATGPVVSVAFYS
jgi:DegV family protein with EDD domain